MKVELEFETRWWHMTIASDEILQYIRKVVRPENRTCYCGCQWLMGKGTFAKSRHRMCVLLFVLSEQVRNVFMITFLNI